MEVLLGMLNIFIFNRGINCHAWIAQNGCRLGALFVMLLLLIGVQACSDGLTPTEDCGCNFVQRNGAQTMSEIPETADNDPKISRTGKWISYQRYGETTYTIQNLATQYRDRVNIDESLKQGEVMLFLNVSSWCPYDEDRVLITAEIGRTTADGKSLLGKQLFFYNVVTHECQRITPAQFGDSTLISPDIQWKPASTFGNDTLVFNRLSLSAVIPEKTRPWLYVVQSGKIIYDRAGIDRWWSSTGSVFEYDWRSHPTNWSVDGKTVRSHDGIVLRMSWSPSGKNFLVCSDRYGYKPCGTTEVWIYSIGQSSYDKPQYVINMLSQECLLSTWGAQACFTSDSTIAMQIHKYGDSHAYLSEVAFDGKIVRQLTY